MKPNCTVCGGATSLFLPEVTDPVTSERFAVWKCAACGVGGTVPQPGDLSRYYGAVYYGNRHSFTARHCIRRRLRRTAAVAGAPAGRRLLDVGCGDGSFLLAARAAGWSVTGVEIHPEPARAAGLEVVTELGQLPPEVRFDCITLWHSLEHFRDVRGALAELTQRLVPGGRLLIAVPDVGSIPARLFGRHWLHLDVPRHLYHFDTAALRNALKQVGLTVERRWGSELEYDLLGWSQSWMNAFFPVPNLFFNCLVGRPGAVHPDMRRAAWMLGILLTALCLPPALLATWLGRGGTCLVAARRAESGG
jgi:SAM-dependent methyltransferase